MKVRVRTIELLLAVSFPICFLCQTQPQGEGVSTSGPLVATGKAYKFDKIADGVYFATPNGSMATGSNSVIIVNDRDVMVVDAGVTPAASRALLQDLQAITDKPVRWVIDTHFHYDHTDGNSAFGPGVVIIGHDYVRHAILNLDVFHLEPFKTGISTLPNQIELLKKQISNENDPERRVSLEKMVAAASAEMEEIKEVKPTPPTMTYTSKMTLFLGDREIQLLFLGRGHTQGDTIVFLPKERIVCTGDLIEARLAYMGDAVFDEWIMTLDALKKLDFDTALPGHGGLFHSKAQITAYQNYLQDLMHQVADLRKHGLTAEEAAQKVDLTSHKADFPQIQGPGAEIRGVRRMYQWMDETTKH